MIINEEDFLNHHGIKGQRWGVRKQKYEAAKTNVSSLNAEVAKRQTMKRLQSTLTEQDFSRLSDKDFVIKKGSVINRVSKDPNLDSKSQSLYVSTNKKDADAYKALIPTFETGGVQKEHSNFYESTFEATNNLKSPSEKKRVKAYIDLMDQPEIQLNSGEKISGREYLSRQGLGSVVNKLNSKQLALTYYGQLSSVQGIKNEPLNTAYFNKLKDKGFNALIDDNDRGVFANTPLLVFDSQTNLKNVNVKRLTTEEVHEAQAALKLPD